MATTEALVSVLNDGCIAHVKRDCVVDLASVVAETMLGATDDGAESADS
jgi:alpha-galactosidase/6-phospho-beta-glucosidase family protein